MSHMPLVSEPSHSSLKWRTLQLAAANVTSRIKIHSQTADINLQMHPANQLPPAHVWLLRTSG